jgi:precorrin-6A/cobalt-precorrin-6A reductase
VCKNSGGTATDAKLQAAREQGITVLMQSRPPRPEVPMAASIADAIDWLRAVRAR